MIVIIKNTGKSLVSLNRVRNDQKTVVLAPGKSVEIEQAELTLDYKDVVSLLPDLKSEIKAEPKKEEKKPEPVKKPEEVKK